MSSDDNLRNNRGKKSNNKLTKSSELSLESLGEKINSAEGLQLTLENIEKKEFSNEHLNLSEKIYNKFHCIKNLENEKDLDINMLCSENYLQSLFNNNEKNVLLKKQEVLAPIPPLFKVLKEENTSGIHQPLYDEIQEITNDIFKRNFNSSMERNVNIFDDNSQIVFQHYNNNYRCKVNYSANMC